MMITIVNCQVGEGFSQKIIPFMANKRVLYIGRNNVLCTVRKHEWEDNPFLSVKYLSRISKYTEENFSNYDLVVIEEVAETTLNMKHIKEIMKSDVDVLIRPADNMRFLQMIIYIYPTYR